MQVQNIQNKNYNSSFESKWKIKDAGNCFSLMQRMKLARFANNIGVSSDLLLLGTSKCKKPFQNRWGDETIQVKKAVKILAVIDGQERCIMVTDKQIRELQEEKKSLYEHVLKILRNLSEQSEGKGSVISKSVRERLKNDLKDFCASKRTYHRETVIDKISVIIKNFIAECKKIEFKLPEITFNEIPRKEPWEYAVENMNGQRPFNDDRCIFERVTDALDGWL